MSFTSFGCNAKTSAGHATTQSSQPLQRSLLTTTAPLILAIIKISFIYRKFSALFLKEKINIKQVLAIIIAFVGALFIIKPQFNFDIIPSLIGVCGAICAAAAYTCLRVLGSKEKYYTIVFYFSFFSTMVILPFMLMVYKEMTLAQLLYLILAGIFASVGQFGVTIAYKYAKAKEISIFDYSNIVFSALISFMLFGTLPDYLSVVGYIIIFTVSLYMFLYNKKLDKIDNK